MYVNCKLYIYHFHLLDSTTIQGGKKKAFGLRNVIEDPRIYQHHRTVRTDVMLTMEWRWI